MGRGYSGSDGRFGERSYGGCGTTGDYGYGVSGHHGESQFGGGAEEEPGQRFIAPEAGESGAPPVQRNAGPSRHPRTPRDIRRSDAEVYEDICEALVERDDVDSSDVTVAVLESEVTLEGSVPERFMRYLIEDLAAGHPSVRDVENRIKVRKA